MYKEGNVFITFTNTFFILEIKNAFLTFFIFFLTFITSMVNDITIKNERSQEWRMQEHITHIPKHPHSTGRSEEDQSRFVAMFRNCIFGFVQTWLNFTTSLWRVISERWKWTHCCDSTRQQGIITHLQCESKNPPPRDFLAFFPNGWEFSDQISRAYCTFCTFLSTLDYTFFI